MGTIRHQTVTTVTTRRMVLKGLYEHRSPVFCAAISPRWMRFPKSPAQMNLVPDHPYKMRGMIKCMACMRA